MPRTEEGSWGCEEGVFGSYIGPINEEEIIAQIEGRLSFRRKMIGMFKALLDWENKLIEQADAIGRGDIRFMVEGLQGDGEAMFVLAQAIDDLGGIHVPQTYTMKGFDRGGYSFLDHPNSFISVMTDSLVGPKEVEVELPRRHLRADQVGDGYYFWINTLLQESRWIDFGDESRLPDGINLGEISYAMPRRIIIDGFVYERYFGQFYLPPWLMSHPDHSKNFYNYFAPYYDKTVDGRFKRRVLGEIFKHVPVTDEVTLDLASGTGVAEKYNRENDLGYRFIGVDVSEGMSELARGRGEEVIIGSADNMHFFPDDKFENGFMSFGWHCLPDHISALDEVWRVLKPDGVFVFNVRDPGKKWKEEIENIVNQTKFGIGEMYLKEIKLSDGTPRNVVVVKLIK